MKKKRLSLLISIAVAAGMMVMPFGAFADSLPTEYSSVKAGNVTSVKNQVPYNTCWAFSSLSTAESSLLARGYGEYDLSELQLVNFFYGTKVDPLGNCSTDKTVNTAGSKLDSGGNHYSTVWAMAGWTAGAAEETMPYNAEECELVSKGAISPALAYEKDVVRLENAKAIPYGTDKAHLDAIKQAIKENGAVASNYYHFYEDNRYLNEKEWAYYCDIPANNHAISIVGWDDNYPASNFNAIGQDGNKKGPEGNGAWLVKNSFSELWGIGGYFWLSYYDVSLMHTGSVFEFNFVPAGDYKYNYQYDGSNGAYSKGINSGESIIAQYQVKGLSSQCEVIDAIGLGLASSNVNYSVMIYDINGIPLMSKPVTGTTDFEGYYTVSIENGPVLKAGAAFTVVVTLSGQDASKPVYVAVDAAYENNFARFEPDNSKDATYYTEGDAPKQFENATIRLKAFSNEATRLEMVENLWEKAGCPEVNGSFNFTDMGSVDKSSDSYKAVAWAVEKGITNGVSAVSFAPDAKVTAKQADLFTARYNMLNK